MKWRFFRHLLGGKDDPDSERVYRWHIEERSGHRMRQNLSTDQWKTSVDEYVTCCEGLAIDMLIKGFNHYFAVPVDRQMNLLDGSHRLACALAAQIDEISVMIKDKPAWAPPWNLAWFMARGASVTDIVRIKEDWKAMHA